MRTGSLTGPQHQSGRKTCTTLDKLLSKSNSVTPTQRWSRIALSVWSGSLSDQQEVVPSHSNPAPVATALTLWTDVRILSFAFNQLANAAWDYIGNLEVSKRVPRRRDPVCHGEQGVVAEDASVRPSSGTFRGSKRLHYSHCSWMLFSACGDMRFSQLSAILLGAVAATKEAAAPLEINC